MGLRNHRAGGYLGLFRGKTPSLRRRRPAGRLGGFGFEPLEQRYLLAADLELSVTASKTDVHLGDEVTLTVKLTNNGPDAATGVKVSSLIPAELADAEDTSSGNTPYDRATGVWTVSSLPGSGSGSSATLTIVGKINVADVTFFSTAEITEWTANQTDPDSTPGNGVTTEDDFAYAGIVSRATADLEVDSVVDNPLAGKGERVTFTITVTNRGPQAATNVVVEQAVPAELINVTSLASPGTYYDRMAGQWNIPSLSATAGRNSVTLQITGTVNATGRFTSTAEIIASNAWDPDATPDNQKAEEDDQDSTGVGAAVRDETKIQLYGTDASDTFELTVIEEKTGIKYRALVNGKSYMFLASGTTEISFDGGDGHDRAEVFASSLSEQVSLNPGTMEITGTGVTLKATSCESITVDSGGGDDVALLYGTDGNDNFKGLPDVAVMYGDTFTSRVSGFRYVRAYPEEGTDIARLIDSAGNDALVGTSGYCMLSGTNYELLANLFDQVYVYSRQGGVDKADLYDSDGDDAFLGSPVRGKLTGLGYLIWAEGFDQVHAHGSGKGTDLATLQDSAGDDVLDASPTLTRLHGSGFDLYVHSYDSVTTNAWVGGRDVANLTGSTGNDRLRASGRAAGATPSTDAILSGAGFHLRARFFEEMYAHGNGGYDRASIQDSAGADRLEAQGNWARLSDAAVTFLFQATDFDMVRASGTQSNGETVDTKQVGPSLQFILNAVDSWKDAT